MRAGTRFVGGKVVSAMRARRIGGASFVVAVVAALVAVAPAPARASVASPDWAALAECVEQPAYDVVLTDGGYRMTDVTRGYVYDASVLSEPVWAAPPRTDPVEQLGKYGLQWMPSLLAALRDQDQAARLDGLVDGVARTLTWRPDNGAATDPVWNEGVTDRREQDLNCLYHVTGDARLAPLMEALAAANLDPGRYYGPPLRLPHNHGLMANLALLDTAALLGRTDLRDAAFARLSVAIDASFTPSGVSIEQSTEYHHVVVALWTSASAEIRASGAAEAVSLADRIDADLVRARAAYQYLVAPDGWPVPIGDMQAARTAPSPQRSTSFVDRTAGLLAARWSWTAPDDFWTLRFGVGRRMHGHTDRMSIVWWATGRPVIVDPGTASYVPGAASTWSRSALAHSIPSIRGRNVASRSFVALSSYTHRVRGDIAVLNGPLFGVTQSRRVAVDPVANRMVVTDRAALPLTQVWQLSGRWRLGALNAARTVARFTDASGGVLLVTTTGRIASVVRGQPGLTGGWTFSYPPEVRTSAARMLVVGGTTTTTTFAVTGTPQRPWSA